MADVIILDQVRARRLPVPIPIRQGAPPPKSPLPQEMIRAAADRWLVDSILSAAEELASRLDKTAKPLRPDERVVVMHVAALFKGQPVDPS